MLSNVHSTKYFRQNIRKLYAGPLTHFILHSVVAKIACSVGRGHQRNSSGLSTCSKGQRTPGERLLPNED